MQSPQPEQLSLWPQVFSLSSGVTGSTGSSGYDGAVGSVVSPGYDGAAGSVVSPGYDGADGPVVSPGFAGAVVFPGYSGVPMLLSPGTLPFPPPLFFLLPSDSGSQGQIIISFTGIAGISCFIDEVNANTEVPANKTNTKAIKTGSFSLRINYSSFLYVFTVNHLSAYQCTGKKNQMYDDPPVEKNDHSGKILSKRKEQYSGNTQYIHCNEHTVSPPFVVLLKIIGKNQCLCENVRINVVKHGSTFVKLFIFGFFMPYNNNNGQ